jgi:hypothetical protein
MWRYFSKRLENLYTVALIQDRYRELLNQMMRPDPAHLVRIRKWFSLSQKYVQYFARGGAEFLREADMRSFSIASLPRLPMRTYQLDASHLFDLAHEMNWKLIRGKRLPEDDPPWSARFR